MKPTFSIGIKVPAVRAALLLVVVSLFILCNRNNPFDSKGVNYIAGKKPHATFVRDTLSGFLYDTIPVQIVWVDTTTGGQKGAIRKFYFSWTGDTTWSDSSDGTDADTFVIRKAFSPGVRTARVKALDFEGQFSDPDSVKLIIRLSTPRIISTSVPEAVAKMSICSLAVSALDTGGAIRAYLWARNGIDFRDTTATGILSTSFTDTGAQTILVKVRDNKGVESGVDTLRLAVFEKVYSTLYNGNGNTSGSVPVDKTSYARGQSVTVLSNSGVLSKTGYAFVGWNTQANGGGASYTVGASFTMDTLPVTLFAQWTLDPTHTVTYDGNGAAGAVPVDSGLYTLGQTVIVLGNTGGLEMPGHTFVGWNTQANGSGISYAAGVDFTMGAANITLYAQWTADPTYSVTYNGNGNTSGSVPIDANNYTAGATVTALANTGNLARTGYAFVGWNTQPAGNGVTYASGVTYQMGSQNVTLYAQWTADPTFTVTYNGNENTGGNAPTDVNSYLAGAMVTTRGAANLVRAGYSFTGWNTLATGTGIAYAAGATFTIGSANVILYAQWAINPTFTVTYNGNASTGGSVPSDTAHYSLGQSVTVLGNSGSLVKTGFTFVGWNTQANGSGVSYAAGVAFAMGSANITLFAQWSANPTYSVNYDANGSTSGTGPVDANNYTAGATVTVLGNTGNLARTGYTFVGWNTQAGGSGTAYATGVTFPMGTANVTLYAQWTANPTFVVVYNGNGNTSGTVPTDVNSYLAGATVTTRGPGNLARTGYSFTGWNTAINGGGTAYAAGATFAMGSASVTLYAQWALNPTFTVTYNGNTNTGGSVPSDTAHYSPGQSVTVLGNSGSLVKTGFTFVGWNTQANGSGISYASGVSFTMGSVNATLYAQWTANPTYTVTYNGNGNASGIVPVDANNYTAGATVTVLGNTGNLARTGYTFVAWNTQAGGGGTAYAAGVTFPMGSASVVLYAQWTANPTFVVTYNGNGNTGGTAPTDVNSYLAGALVTARGAGNLVRTGYTFTGWNTVANGTGTAYAAGSTFAMGSASVTLYAQWALNPTFTVTYNGNTNSGGSVPSDTAHYSPGQSVTVLGNSGSLVKTGFTFVGWNTLANGTGISYASGVNFVMGSANVTLYAMWTSIPTFTVTYIGNGNTGGNVPIDSNNYTAGATVTALGNTGNLTRTGYTFVGWNTKAGGGGTTYASGVTFPMGSASQTLFAQWTANPTFVVTYNGNGSTGGSVPVDSNNYAVGQTVTVRNMGTLVRSGYTFSGWNTLASGGGTAYAPGAPLAMGSGNVILYAQWAINTYTISYNLNGGINGSNPATYTVTTPTITLANPSQTGYTFGGWFTNAGLTGSPVTSIPTGSTGNLAFWAMWTINTYTITYNLNGGTNGSNPATYNATTPTITLANPSQTGYTFGGWFTNAGLTGSPVTSIPTGSTGNLAFWAKWTINTYTITYTLNGGADGGNPATYTVTTPTITLVAPTQNGYTFGGWFTNAGLTGSAVTSIPTGSTGNLAFWAKWTINTFAITYNLNGGTNGNNPATYTVTTPTITLAAPTQNGYTFGGWFTNAGLTGSAATSIPTGSTGNLAFWAKWTIITYTITYNLNGGTDGSNPASYNVTTPTFTLANPTRTGYTFAGWFADAGLTIPAVTTISIGSTGNAAFFAKWTLVSYSITYTLNGGTNDGSNPASYNVTTPTFTLANPTRTGYTFAGWFADAGLTVSAVTTISIGSTGNAAFFAKWTLVSYSITYTLNGGTNDGSNPASYNVTTPTFTLANPTRTGYTFAGWFADVGLTVPAATTISIGSTGNAAFFAKWTIITYTITYNLNGGTNGSNPATYDVTTATITLANPTQTGFTFGGWFTNAGFTGSPVTSIPTGSTGNLAFWAMWTANIDTITFDSNDSAATGSMPAQTIASGSTANLSPNQFAKVGFAFQGWATTSGGAAAYADGASYTMGTSNVTLYAVWK
jgi:uncharacterized repeat protein (TIGR02543 family)